MARNDKSNEPEVRVLSEDEQLEHLENDEKAAAEADYAPETAQQAVKVGHDRLLSRSQKRAEDAGVVHPAFVDYDKALENYQGREDVEPLDQRRAREIGYKFSDASFRREIGGVDNTGVATSTATTDKDPKPEAPEGTVGNEA